MCPWRVQFLLQISWSEPEVMTPSITHLRVWGPRFDPRPASKKHNLVVSVFTISVLGTLIQVALWRSLARQPSLIPNPTRTGANWETLPQRTRQEDLLSPVNIVLEVFAGIIREKKKTKEIQTGKEVQVCLLADDMTLYVKSQRLHPKTHRLEMYSLTHFKLPNDSRFIFCSNLLQQHY